MTKTLKDEWKKWDREIDAEASRLIRNGVSPHDAVEKARETVSRKRRKANDN